MQQEERRGETTREEIDMPTSTTFKTQTDAVPETQETLPSGDKGQETGVVEIEVPYLDYGDSKGKPYTAEYFSLGDRWADTDGGFPEEIGKIESYIERKIKSGEIANSIDAVKNMLKGLEKVNNLAKEERPVVKIEVLTNYIDFISKNAEVFKNIQRYGYRS